MQPRWKSISIMNMLVFMCDDDLHTLKINWFKLKFHKFLRSILKIALFCVCVACPNKHLNFEYFLAPKKPTPQRWCFDEGYDITRDSHMPVWIKFMYAAVISRGKKSYPKRFKLKKQRGRNWVISAVNQMEFITSDDEAAKCDINNVTRQKPKSRLKFRFILSFFRKLKMNEFVMSK